MNSKIEENAIIAINTLKRIIALFLGPFLTAYFIKTTSESIIKISIYNIFSYLILGLSSFIIAGIIKKRFKIGMFRLGVIVNFIYIMFIITLKEDIVNHLPLMSILYGVSSSAYNFPYNLFVINKIENSNRTEYIVKIKLLSSVVGIICPIILGSLITVTNYELTAVVILIISLIQIILSFLLKPMEDTELNKFSLIKTWNQIKHDDQVRKMYIVEFLLGMSIKGALEAVMTILIFNSFKTDMNLGLVSSIATILGMITVYLYGKIYKNRDNSKLIIISSILPVVSLLLLLFVRCNITVILYNLNYIIFVELLNLVRAVKLYNISNSSIIDKNKQAEFFSIREGVLNLGRMSGYALLLIAGIVGNTTILNLVMICLTFALLLMGIMINKVEEY